MARVFDMANPTTEDKVPLRLHDMGHILPPPVDGFRTGHRQGSHCPMRFYRVTDLTLELACEHCEELREKAVWVPTALPKSESQWAPVSAGRVAESGRPTFPAPTAELLQVGWT